MKTATSVPRPQINAPSILEEAAEILATAIFEWCQQDGEQLTDDDLLRIKRDLSNVLNRTWNVSIDGYSLAKELEKGYGYSPDSSLVEILNDAPIFIRESHQRAVKNWVKDNSIVVPFAIGDKVRVTSLFQKNVIGTITRIDSEEAICHVNCPELGHCPPSDQGKLPGSYAIVVPHEALTKEP